MAAKKTYIPFPFKLAGAILLLLTLATVSFAILLDRVLINEKKLAILDLNSSLLNSTSVSLRASLTERLEKIRQLSLVVANGSDEIVRGFDLKTSLPAIADEMVSLTIYETSPNSKLVAIRNYKNLPLMAQRRISDDTLLDLTQRPPVTGPLAAASAPIKLFSRLAEPKIPILAVALAGNFIGASRQNVVVVANLLPEFLKPILKRSEIAEMFLLGANAQLIAHPNAALVTSFSGKKFLHPVLADLQSPSVHQGSLELTVAGERAFVSVADTGIEDVFLVSQIKSGPAYASIRGIEAKAAIVLAALALLISLVCLALPRRLIKNIENLNLAFQRVDAGTFDVQLKLSSHDEVQPLVRSFNAMNVRLREWAQQNAKKIKETADVLANDLVATLVAPSEIPENPVKFQSYYVPARQIGGDFWDVRLNDNILTVLIGDATGHGPAGTTVMAVAKSCFSTLISGTAGQTPPKPHELLSRMNSILYRTGNGKLLMTMFLCQIDLATGELTFANAGHQPPFLVRHSSQSLESLFSVGERLGFSAEYYYLPSKITLDPNDTLLFLTDGVWQAVSPEGKEWGERALRKILVSSAEQNLKTVRDNIANALLAHTLSGEQKDDITFVLLRWDQGPDATKSEKLWDVSRTISQAK